MTTEVAAKHISLATIFWSIALGSLGITIAFITLDQSLLANWYWLDTAMHTTLEISGTLIALFVAFFILRYQQFDRGTPFNMRLAAALLFMGVLDGFHALVAVSETSIWLHSISTFVGGLLFACVILPSWSIFNTQAWPLTTFVVSLCIGLTSILMADALPIMISNNKFTLLANVLNLTGGVLLFIATFKLALCYQREQNFDDLLFCLHCALFGTATFLFHQSSLWDSSWWAWHTLRFAAYVVALWFVIRGETTIMKELSKHRNHLTELVAKQTEEIRQRAALLNDAQRIAHLGCWQRDLKNQTAVWSDEFYRVCGYRPHSVPPTLESFNKLLAPEDKDDFIREYQTALDQGIAIERECRIIRPDGRRRHLKISGIVDCGPDGEPLFLLGTAQDITEQKHYQAKIEHLANHDALTGLPSLRLCRERMSSELSRAKRNKTQFAVMFIDLDGFKQVNDTYGHDIGDLLLQNVAARLINCLRDVDTVARIGGDEFAVLQTDIKDDAAVSCVASKLIDVMAETYQIGEHRLHIGASIGISLYPSKGEDISKLMQQADRAMYQVKKSGKNNFQFA